MVERGVFTSELGGTIGNELTFCPESLSLAADSRHLYQSHPGDCPCRKFLRARAPLQSHVNPQAWGSCLDSSPGTCQATVGAGPRDFTGMVASCVPGPLGTQYGTLTFAHFPQAPVAWLSMFTKGQGCLMGTGLCFC